MSHILTRPSEPLPLYRWGGFSATASPSRGMCSSVTPNLTHSIKDSAGNKFEKLVQLLKKRATSDKPVHCTIASNKVVRTSAQDRQHLVALHNLGSNATNLRAKSPRSLADADLIRPSCCGESHSTDSSSVQFPRHLSYTYGDAVEDNASAARTESCPAIQRRGSLSSSKPPATISHNSSSSSLSSTSPSSSTTSSSSATRARSASGAALPTITSLAFQAVFGELAIKCSYSEDDDLKGDIALVRVDEDRIDFDRLAEQLESFYGFAKRGLEVEVTYTDEEGDKVRIRDTESLTYACRDWRRQLRRKSNSRSLRVVAKGKRRQP